ncbi:MAG TPA: hypothetical protein VEC39_10565 [Vicinamibacterales bacterium]|nr:hypothetical protein [Vicinamibacterales bacterium]
MFALGEVLGHTRPLDGLPAAAGNLLHESDVFFAPDARLGGMDSHRRDEAARLQNRHPNEGANVGGNIRLPIAALDSSVGLNVVHRVRLAGTHQSQALRAELPERVRAGNRLHAVVEIPGQLERLLVIFNRGIRATAGVKVASEGAGRIDGNLLGSAKRAQQVIELYEKSAAPFGVQQRALPAGRVEHLRGVPCAEIGQDAFTLTRRAWLAEVHRQHAPNLAAAGQDWRAVNRAKSHGSRKMYVGGKERVGFSIGNNHALPREK